MAAAKRAPHGGKRPGTGRPRKPREIPWAKVEDYASAHAPEADIRLALDITDAMLGPAELEKFRAIVARGHAMYRLNLRRLVRRRGERSNPKGTDGSVNALALQARNTLDWDRQIPTQEVPPDLGTARARLSDLLLRLAQQTSSVEGRHVSVAEMLSRESAATKDDGKGGE